MGGWFDEAKVARQQQQVLDLDAEPACVTQAPLYSAPVAVQVTGRERYVAPAETGGADFWFASLAPAVR